MTERKHALIHKAPVEGMSLHVGRAGLSIGDSAFLHLLPEGRPGVFARVSRPFLGLFPRRRLLCLGYLGPAAAAIIEPALQQGADLRVRIVGITPEHLSAGGQPEIFVSVWGDPRHARPLPRKAPPQPPEPTLTFRSASLLGG